MEQRKLQFGGAGGAGQGGSQMAVGGGDLKFVDDSPKQQFARLDLKQEPSKVYPSSGGAGDQNANWYELRFQQLGPDRRGYHSTFQHNKRLFIYGGHDIREGSKDSLWMLDLRKLRDMELTEPSQQQRDCMWKQIPMKGDERPGPLAHHTSVVLNDKMYLYGGSNLETENGKFFSLDLNTFKWEVVKIRGGAEFFVPRDEHTAVLNEADASMVVFGGFLRGQRTNDMVKYFF